MILAAVTIVFVSYQVLVPARAGPRFPADHGLQAIDDLSLEPTEADFYKCMLTWAEANADELRIGSDWMLVPIMERNGYTIRNGEVRIESSGFDASAQMIDGGWYVTAGPFDRWLRLRPPCPLPAGQ